MICEAFVREAVDRVRICLWKCNMPLYKKSSELTPAENCASVINPERTAPTQFDEKAVIL